MLLADASRTSWIFRSKEPDHAGGLNIWILLMIDYCRLRTKRKGEIGRYSKREKESASDKWISGMS